MKVAVTLTGDPIHLGHIHLLREAAKIGSHVTIFLPINPDKDPETSIEARLALMKDIITEEKLDPSRVIVKPLRSGYTAEVAKREGISYLIRGLRNTTDFQYEDELNYANTVDLDGVPTLYLISPPQYQRLSSSYIRKLKAGHQVGWHWAVKDKLPRVVYNKMVMDFLTKEWYELWAGTVGGDHDKADALERLVWLYSGADRCYHNLDHLVHLLCEINEWEHETDQHVTHTRQVKAAAWFHDSLMGFGRVKEPCSWEHRSAQYWLDSEMAARMSATSRNGVAQLIQATDHFQQNGILHPLKEVLLSVDLAILGQKRAVYDQYAMDIREEYSAFMDGEYYPGRRQALTSLLNKDKLFGNEYFHRKYEIAARANLHRELDIVHHHIPGVQCVLP